MHHVDCDIAPLASMPRIAYAHRFFDDDAGVFANSLPVECRLRRQPLGAVRSTFAGNHALAQQHLGAVYGALFNKVIVLHHQHFADVFRMVEKDDVVRPDLVVRDIAVGLSEMLKQNYRVCGAKLAEARTTADCAVIPGGNGTLFVRRNSLTPGAIAQRFPLS